MTAALTITLSLRLLWAIPALLLVVMAAGNAWYRSGDALYAVAVAVMAEVAGAGACIILAFGGTS